jgi:hypothetical protein
VRPVGLDPREARACSEVWVRHPSYRPEYPAPCKRPLVVLADPRPIYETPIADSESVPASRFATTLLTRTIGSKRHSAATSAWLVRTTCPSSGLSASRYGNQRMEKLRWPTSGLVRLPPWNAKSYANRRSNGCRSAPGDAGTLASPTGRSARPLARFTPAASREEERSGAVDQTWCWCGAVTTSPWLLEASGGS